MIQPSFTAAYRLQLHKDFTLKKVEELLPYFTSLEISHLYLSPLLESRSGSGHGYDGTDPNTISRERGGIKAWESFLKKIKATDLKIILDIVPNHLAAHWENPWWSHVLREGKQSKYWDYFDFRCSPGDKIILPVLGEKIDKVLSQNFLIVKHEIGYGFYLDYFNNRFPIAESSIKFLEMYCSKPEAFVPIHKWKSKDIDAFFNNQHYKLEFWREGLKKINYRRFFDVSDLVCLNIQNLQVFNDTHKMIQVLLKSGKVDGLRIDHIDGLAEPAPYLKKLNRWTRNIWVEKILAEGERLPANWPIRGETGYGYSACVDKIFVDPIGYHQMRGQYHPLNNRWQSFGKCLEDSKKELLSQAFQPEWISIWSDFKQLLPTDIQEKKVILDNIREFLIEFLIHFPVYRTYMEKGVFTESDVLMLTTLKKKLEKNPKNKRSSQVVFQILFQQKRAAVRDWVMKLQQFTGPLMAKGLEDTAHYRYTPLLSLNEVGAEPLLPLDAVDAFHGHNLRHLAYPLCLNNSSTHDSKRSEDLRYRISALSEFPEAWNQLVKKGLSKWKHLPGLKKLDTQTLYFLLQVLTGLWSNKEPKNKLKERIKSYSIKAGREAKTQTSWTEPNQAFENALTNAIDIIWKQKCKGLREDLESLSEKITYYGALNSLSSLTIKICSPGIPDIYQGTELWHTKLVDPDNRQPVDYQLRKQLLKKVKTKTSETILSNWKSGETKLWTLHKLLHFRKNNPDLFLKGDYTPLRSSPEHNRFVGFLRNWKNRWLIVIVPRLVASGQLTGKFRVDSNLYQGTTIRLPKNAPTQWVNLFTGKKYFGKSIDIKNLFTEFPVALLMNSSSSVS